MAISSLVSVVIRRSTGSFSLQAENTAMKRIEKIPKNWSEEFILGMGSYELTA
jgi:hypothetical protein